MEPFKNRLPFQEELLLLGEKGICKFTGNLSAIALSGIAFPSGWSEN